MARANKLKLVVSLLENELSVSDDMIGAAARTGHYREASEFQKYKEGVLHALSIIKVCSGQEASSEDKD